MRLLIVEQSDVQTFKEARSFFMVLFYLIMGVSVLSFKHVFFKGRSILWNNLLVLLFMVLVYFFMNITYAITDNNVLLDLIIALLIIIFLFILELKSQLIYLILILKVFHFLKSI